MLEWCNVKRKHWYTIKVQTSLTGVGAAVIGDKLGLVEGKSVGDDVGV